MTAAYHGLAGDPFDKHFAKPANCFRSEDFRAATARLGHLKETRGIGLLTAAPGMGKSLALRCFADGLNQNLYKPLYISMSTLTVGEFHKQLCSEPGIADAYGKAGLVKAAKAVIEDMYTEKRRTLVLMLDEAQYLNADVLRDLKILMNFRYDSLNCMAMVLCGEPYLRGVLRRPVNEALRQRIAVHYDYKGLGDDEVQPYIMHKIHSASGSESIIDQSAVNAVHGIAGGNPRLIDGIMSDALVLGGQMDKKTIDAEVIVAASENRAL